VPVDVPRFTDGWLLLVPALDKGYVPTKIDRSRSVPIHEISKCILFFSNFSLTLKLASVDMLGLIDGGLLLVFSVKGCITPKNIDQVSVSDCEI
jgi:hypothetical protein